jgi:hypothetical protein
MTNTELFQNKCLDGFKPFVADAVSVRIFHVICGLRVGIDMENRIHIALVCDVVASNVVRKLLSVATARMDQPLGVVVAALL